MSTTTADRLAAIFRAVFNVNPGQDVTRLSRENTEQWDSLAHVQLVMAIESELGITLDAAEQLRMVDYGATARLLEERGLL
jgi:acyl carrier protein